MSIRPHHYTRCSSKIPTLIMCELSMVGPLTQPTTAPTPHPSTHTPTLRTLARTPNTRTRAPTGSQRSTSARVRTKADPGQSPTKPTSNQHCGISNAHQARPSSTVRHIRSRANPPHSVNGIPAARFSYPIIAATPRSTKISIRWCRAG